MMITHYDFLLMTEPEQYEAVWKGTFLGDRKHNGRWIQTYYLDSFYVDVEYDQKANDILGIWSYEKRETPPQFSTN